MLERVPATAEPVSQLFVRSFEKPYRSHRVLDLRFWHHASPNPDATAWWPQYLQKIRTTQQTRETARKRHEDPLVAAARGAPWPPIARMFQTEQVLQVSTARNYTISLPRHKQKEQEVEDTEYIDAFGVDKLWKDDDEPSIRRDELPDQDSTDVAGPPPSRRKRPPRDAVDELLKDRQVLGVQADQETGGNPTSSFRLTTSSPAQVNAAASDDTVESFGVFGTEALNAKKLAQKRNKVKEPVRPGTKISGFYRDPVMVGRNLPAIAPTLTEISYATIPDGIPSAIHPYMGSASLRRDRLIHSFLSREALDNEQNDRVWQLFISMDNQEDVASYIFDTLTKNLPLYTTDRQPNATSITSDQDARNRRALEAFRIMPLNFRDQNRYPVAINLHLQVGQFRPATMLALEASNRGIDEAPKLTAFFVENELWAQATELLYRMTNRQSIARFGSPHVQGDLLSTNSNAPNMRDLVQRCFDQPSIINATLALAERLQSSSAALIEYFGAHRRLLQLLATGCVSRHSVMQHAAASSVLALVSLDSALLEGMPSSLNLHEMALDTIFELPNRESKSDLAIAVYRNYRWIHPNRIPTPAVLGRLTRLCQDAVQDLEVYEYLLDEARKHMDKPSPRIYQRVMTACAAQGEVDLTSNYLDQCIADHGLEELNIAHFSPLIQAHARNGDAAGVEKQMNRLRSEFAIEPNGHCWNMLLACHVRNSDSDQAYQVFEQMAAKDIPYDSHTYGSMLELCKRTVDLEAALMLLAEARQRQIPLTTPMLDNIVNIYLARAEVHEALEFAKLASASGPSNDLTRLWNNFLRHYALKGDNNGIDATGRRMRQLGVRFNDFSVLYLLTAQVVSREFEGAANTLREMQQRPDIPLGPMHYMLVLGGLVQGGRRDWGTTIVAEMSRRFPNLSSIGSAAMLVLKNKSVEPIHPQGGASVAFEVQLFKEMWSLAQPSSNAPTKRAHREGITRVGTTFFWSVIQRIMTHESRNHVESSLAELEQIISEGGPQKATDKLMRQIAISRMKLAHKYNDDKTVHAIWQKEFERASRRTTSLSAKLAERSDRDTNLARGLALNRTAPSRIQPWQLSLSSLLDAYMDFMAEREQMQAVTEFLAGPFRAAGFVVTAFNQNKYVQLLSLSTEPHLRVRAFRVVEQTMFTRAQNWHLLVRGLFRHKASVKHLTQLGNTGREVDQVSVGYSISDRKAIMKIQPHRMIPTYTTMVHLAAALLVAQLRSKEGQPREKNTIDAYARRTKRFVQQIPFMEDKVQDEVLRKDPPAASSTIKSQDQRHVQFKPLGSGPSEHSSLFDQIPLEFVQDIEQHILDRRTRFQALLGHEPISDVPDTYRPADDVLLGEQLYGQIDRSVPDPKILREEDALLVKVRQLRAAVKRRLLGQDRPQTALEGSTAPWSYEEPPVTDQQSQTPQQAESSPIAAEEGQQADEVAETTEESMSQHLVPTKHTPQRPVYDDEWSELFARPRDGKRPRYALEYKERRVMRDHLAAQQRLETKQDIETAGYSNFSDRALVARSKAAKRRERQELGAARLQNADQQSSRDSIAPHTERGVWRGILERNNMRNPSFVFDLNRRRRRHLVRKGKRKSVLAMMQKGEEKDDPDRDAGRPQPPVLVPGGQRKRRIPKKKDILIYKAKRDGQKIPVFSPYTNRKKRQLIVMEAIKDRDYLPYNPPLSSAQAG